MQLSAINSAIASVGTMRGKSLIPFETYGWYILNPLYYYNWQMVPRRVKLSNIKTLASIA